MPKEVVTRAEEEDLTILFCIPVHTTDMKEQRLQILLSSCAATQPVLVNTQVSIRASHHRIQ
jgi:hypothetical protein